jgi:hypothetical protein
MRIQSAFESAGIRFLDNDAGAGSGFGLCTMANWDRLHVTVCDHAGAQDEDRLEAPTITRQSS